MWKVIQEKISDIQMSIEALNRDLNKVEEKTLDKSFKKDFYKTRGKVDELVNEFGVFVDAHNTIVDGLNDVKNEVENMKKRQGNFYHRINELVMKLIDKVYDREPRHGLIWHILVALAIGHSLAETVITIVSLWAR